MKRSYKCLGCGATTTSTDGRPPIQLIDGDGRPVGCAFCGSKQYRVVLPQVVNETEQMS